MRRLLRRLTRLRQPVASRVFIPTGDECKDDEARTVSADLIKSIVAVAHQGRAGHRPGAVTRRAVERHFSWKALGRDVTSVVKSCLQCLKNSAGEFVPRPMAMTLLGEFPNEVVHFDFVYMRPGFQLTIKDSLSGFCKLSYHEHCTADEAAQGLMEWIALFQAPAWLVSDGGSHFANKVFF